MNWKWFVWEVEEKPHCDYCSWVPDVILGFPFYEACRIHDYLYRGILLGLTGDDNLKKIARRKADWKFWGLMDEIVKEHAINLPHELVGRAIALNYFIGVRLFGWMSY